MSDKAKHEPKLHGVTAEFDSVESLLTACERVRDAGYKLTDAFTPFPVLGVDKALGIKPTGLPWIVLGGGVTGCLIGLAMQIWMNGIDYPYIISGKPYISLPAFIPVAFELTILLASFGAFLGMLALNKLPRFSNPVFTNPRFDRATDDRFFLYIGAEDERFDLAGVRRLLGDCQSLEVADVVEDDTPSRMPRFIMPVLGFLALFALVPPLVIARMRVTESGSPRFHVFYDMDFSPSKDAQQLTSLFADGRAMRPDVPGTIARGELRYDANFQTGIDLAELAKIDPVRAARLVGLPQETDEGEATPAEDPPVNGEEGDQPAVEEPAAEEKDAGEQPADEQPPEEKASDEKPAEEKPAEEKASDGESAEEKPAGEEPAEEKPADEAPAEDKPAEEKGSDDAPAEEQPAGDEPMDNKSDAAAAEAQPAAGEPAEPMEKAADETTEAAPPAEEGAAPAAAVDLTPWLDEIPVDVTTGLLEKGQQQFDIYCAVCHGADGSGNGLVNRRAQKILSQWWVPPSSLHDPTLYEDAYPNGKLFSTITHGIRKMPGYGSQIETKDRWAVVAYVRALQRSRNAQVDDVPADRREALLQEQAEVRAALEQAAAEARAKQNEAQADETPENADQ